MWSHSIVPCIRSFLFGLRFQSAAPQLLCYNSFMTDIESALTPGPKKNPWIAFFLTLLFPGLGHFYVGNKFSALAYVIITTGIYISYFSAHSFLARTAVLFIVPFFVFPAARDAVAVARGKKRSVTGEESRIYVVWMLCCVGPFAIPLLWQNKKFSLPVKIVWTVVVVAIVAMFLSAIAVLGKSYDQIAQAINM